MKTVSISGSDTALFPYLQTLIASLQGHPQSASVDLAVLHPGLPEEHLDWLAGRVAHVLELGWNLRDPVADPDLQFMKIMDARSMLPDLVPGYDIYVWIDADAWVQRWEAVDLLIRGAADGAAAAAAELHPKFRLLMSGPKVTHLPAVLQDRVGLFEAEERRLVLGRDRPVRIVTVRRRSRPAIGFDAEAIYHRIYRIGRRMMGACDKDATARSEQILEDLKPVYAHEMGEFAIRKFPDLARLHFVQRVRHDDQLHRAVVTRDAAAASVNVIDRFRRPRKISRYTAELPASDRMIRTAGP